MSQEPSEETENFYRRLFRTSLKLARRNIFGKVRFLLLLFVKKVTSSCASPQHPQQGRRYTKFSCTTWQTKTCYKPSIVQSYNNFMGGVDASDAMLYSYLDERRMVKCWKKIAFNIFSRMILNNYIIYKQNLSAGCNAISRSDYTIKIIDALSKEWLEEKYYAVGILGTTMTKNDTKFIRKLPAKKEKDCCVCSKRTKNGPVKRRRSRTVCVKCEKGLHGECFPQHK